MRRLVCAAALACAGISVMAGETLEPIEKVAIGADRVMRVNGKPFFPIMSWAQSTRRFKKLRALNFNTFCGSGKTYTASIFSS